MQWKTLDEVCRSDHYPITVCLGTSEISSAMPSSKFHNADRVFFSDKAREQLCSGNPGISIDEFFEKLIAIATNTIPKSKFSHRKHNTIWINDTCNEAISKRKKALRKVSSRYSSSQHASPLRELICHMAEVTFLPLPQPTEAGTRFSDPFMDARMSWPGWYGYILRWCTCPTSVTHPSANQAQCRVSLFMWWTMLLLRQTNQ